LKLPAETAGRGDCKPKVSRQSWILRVRALLWESATCPSSRGSEFGERVAETFHEICFTSAARSDWRTPGAGQRVGYDLARAAELAEQGGSFVHREKISYKKAFSRPGKIAPARQVYEAYKAVKSNRAAGVDGQTLEMFVTDLAGNRTRS
jgi:hypothetical protein